jgi:hypothetical protein
MQLLETKKSAYGRKLDERFFSTSNEYLHQTYGSAFSAIACPQYALADADDVSFDQCATCFVHKAAFRGAVIVAFQLPAATPAQPARGR